MKINISIDDTDNLESPGSGQLSEILAKELQQTGLVRKCSNITRHQLFFHQDIPYTSHNSGMCFSADIADTNIDDVILYAQQFLEMASAPGSDPGLCVAVKDSCSGNDSLIDFGLKAQREILTKEEAYFLAQEAGVHLSEHGGTGDGVVGALAATSLRLCGNDGRFRGWLNLGKTGQVLKAREICSHPFINEVIDDTGTVLPEDGLITLSDEKLKTVFLNHRQVIPVKRSTDISGSPWTTLTSSEVKKY